MSTGLRNRVMGALAAAALGLSACSGLGKGPGFEVDLQKEAYQADFGAATGTLPDLACDAGSTSACDAELVADVSTAVTGTPTDVVLSAGCDAASQRCYAQAAAQVAESVDVRLDQGFAGKVEGRLVSFVHVLDLAYAVTQNSLTFDLPKIDVYVGPAGSTRSTDAGVVFVSSTISVAAGTTLGDGHLTVDDSSPARSIIENAVRAQQAFVFVLVLSPKILAGQPVPAGTIEVDVTPKLTVGL